MERTHSQAIIHTSTHTQVVHQLFNNTKLVMEDVDEIFLVGTNSCCPGKTVCFFCHSYILTIASLQGLPLANYSLPRCHILSGELNSASSIYGSNHCQKMMDNTPWV